MKKFRFWFKRYYVTPGVYSIRNAAILAIIVGCISFLIKTYHTHLHPSIMVGLFFSPIIFVAILIALQPSLEEKRLPINQKAASFTAIIAFGFMVLWFVVQFFRSIPNYATFSFTTNLQRAFFVYFGASWLFILLKLANQILLKRVEGEWWIDIRREGNIPTPDDLKVGNEKIDYTLFIYGEPRTWWERRIKEPQALDLLDSLTMHANGICSLSGADGPVEVKPQFLQTEVTKWQHALRQNPPTPKDWKDSAADFSVPAHKKMATASQSGSPIAVPSLTGEDEG